jgi:hypothetical protein
MPPELLYPENVSYLSKCPTDESEIHHYFNSPEKEEPGMAAQFYEVLKTWEGGKVTIINPQSFNVSKLGVKISLEHYEATLEAVAQDFVQVSFASPKGDEQVSLTQYIPLNWIKRASDWGGDRFLQL